MRDILVEAKGLDILPKSTSHWIPASPGESFILGKAAPLAKEQGSRKQLSYEPLAVNTLGPGEIRASILQGGIWVAHHSICRGAKMDIKF